MLQQSAQQLLQHKISFYALARNYMEDEKFIAEWKSILQNSIVEFYPAMTRGEYIRRLFPVFFCSLTAFFGFLLGISNFQLFENLFSDFYMVIMAVVITVIITIASTRALYKDIERHRQTTAFMNWFFLGLLTEILLYQRRPLPSSRLEYEVDQQLRQFLGYVFTHCLAHPVVYSTVFQQQFVEKLQSHPDEIIPQSFLAGINQIFIDSAAVSTGESKVKPNQSLLKIKGLIANQVLWDATIGNFAMATGFIGVYVGLSKSILHFFGFPVFKGWVTGNLAVLIGVSVIVIIMLFNFYFRFKSENYLLLEQQLLKAQDSFVTQCGAIVRVLGGGEA